MSPTSRACGGGDARRAMVPGSLRGYRMWRLRRWADVSDGSLPLTSVTRRHVLWTPTLVARCEPADVAIPGPSSSTLDSGHHAPQTGCTCGIYGWYAPTDTCMAGASVFGVIEASGLVLMGESGFRAEKAKVAAVATRNRRVTAACTRAGIPVYRRRRDLLRDYPPEDLSSVLGDTQGSEHRSPARGAHRDRDGQLQPPAVHQEDSRVGDWAADNNVELAYVPTNAIWLNRIEAQFQALRYFALDGTDHRTHDEQNRMIRRYIA